MPPGTPTWGSQWKQAVRDNYLSTVYSGAGVHASWYAYRDNHLDLDPTYTDRFGRPLLRMTMDFHENELKMDAYLNERYGEIIARMGAKQVVKLPRNGPYDITAYQTSHLCGGAIMGTDPGNSARQQVSAELGCAEPVRAGRERVSAERRLQPDRHRRGARLLERRGDPLAISQEPGAARPCVACTPSPQLRCSASRR